MITALALDTWERYKVDVRAQVWQVYIGLCLALWGVLITAPDDTWRHALTHWPMALVMIAGSLVAGSTPMGGGTIAFPALVLGFGESPALARDFGLAIQAIGMTSALLFIVKRGIPVESRLLMWSCAGAVIGLTFGTYVLATWVPADWVKLLFATLWLTFGAWLVTGTAKATAEPRPSTEGTNVAMFGIVVGIIGGAIASLIGVGVEMLVYATLVLRFGWGPKAAVPTAVCTTALVSPVGLILRAMSVGIHPVVFPTWMACVPIVIFGAPAGAYISTRMPRPVLLRIIGALVLVQFAVTVHQVRPSLEMWGGVLALAIVGGVGLWLLAPSDRTRKSEPAARTAPEPIDRRDRLASVTEPRPEVAFEPKTTPQRTLAPVAAPASAYEPISTPPPPPIVPSLAPVIAVTSRMPEPSLPVRVDSAGDVNLAHVYLLGARVHPLGDVAEGANRRDWLLRYAPNVGVIESALHGDPSLLLGAREPAVALVRAVDALAGRGEDAISGAEARTIQAAHREFEQTLCKGLEKESAIHVPRVGIFETTLLLNRADQVFPADVLSRLSEQTRAEWRLAGRCLAFKLGTACGFHTVRATESVIDAYESGEFRIDPKVAGLVNHIRQHHPVSRPGLTLDANEAYALFNVAQSVIVTLVTALPARTPAAEREWA